MIHAPGRLFDEPAYDEATGKKVGTKDLEPADAELRVVKPEEGSEDVMGALPEEEDEASAWLRENDRGHAR